jgi:hypothetical protein
MTKAKFRLKYRGPGNCWDLYKGKSKIFAEVTHRQACTYIKSVGGSV